MTVTLNSEGLVINGQTVPVYSGSVHYWRLERELWPLILDQVRALGFGMIETYIPWSVHETSPGAYDWGQDDPKKDIEAFMQLCEERGIWLQVRPGPLINAELTDFGFPEWVLLNPEVQARTSLDSLHLDAAWGLHPPHQFPVPSYASEAFYEAVGDWLDAVCPLIKRHLAPAGCIVAVQSDNETCYMFNDKAYATDYSPASLSLYRSFLQKRYVSITALNKLYGTQYEDFEAVEPPRDCEIEERQQVAWHLDWIAYKEFQIRWAVARISRMMKQRGIEGVPIFHDVAYQYRTPLDLARLEAEPDIDWVGLNLYANKENYRGAIQKMRFLAGTTRLPFVPEFGCGIWSHFPLTPTPDEQEFITLSAYMHGLKAINFYMLVERERWQGSPITRHGTFRPEYAAFYTRLSGFLKRYHFEQFKRLPQALVLMNYDLGRYSAMASTLHYAHVDLYGLPRALSEVKLDLELRWNVEAEADHRRQNNWLGTVISKLETGQIDYDLSDSHLNPEKLAQYPLVCLQTVDFMDGADQQRLLEYVEAGGTLLLGPGMPYLDPALNPCSVLGNFLERPGEIRLGKGRLIWVEQPEIQAALEKLVAPGIFSCDRPDLDLIAHQKANSTLLFVANPTSRPLKANILFKGIRTFHNAMDPDHTIRSSDQLPLNFAAYSVQIWEVCCD